MEENPLKKERLDRIGEIITTEFDEMKRQQSESFPIMQTITIDDTLAIAEKFGKQLYQDEQHPTDRAFVLGEEGESVYMFSAEETGNAPVIKKYSKSVLNDRFQAVSA